jgi:hypothetical protein
MWECFLVVHISFFSMHKFMQSYLCVYIHNLNFRMHKFAMNFDLSGEQILLMLPTRYNVSFKNCCQNIVCFLTLLISTNIDTNFDNIVNWHMWTIINIIDFIYMFQNPYYSIGFSLWKMNFVHVVLTFNWSSTSSLLDIFKFLEQMDMHKEEI